MRLLMTIFSVFALFFLSLNAKAAVSINNNGIGQVLLFPYYTVNNNLSTLISVVNTTDKTKAIKVRFLEGKGGKTVLDFNLYLAAYEVWTASLSHTVSTSSPFGIIGNGFTQYIGQDSALIKTNDNSCTVPNEINQIQFKPYAFDNDAIGINDMIRVREGYFTFIEMGEVTGEYAESISTSCNLIKDLWFEDFGESDAWFISDGAENVEENLDGKGGLYGSAYIVDAENGLALTYNAIALQNFKFKREHTAPGSTEPSIVSLDSTSENLWQSVVGDTVTNWDNPVDAISSLFMHDNLYNDFVIEDVIAAETEWVLTFPTKKHLVDPQFSTSPKQPFSVPIATGLGACEVSEIQAFDRRSTPFPHKPRICPIGTAFFLTDCDGNGICIVPPGTPPQPLVCENDKIICWQTNVIKFSNVRDQDTERSTILDSSSQYDFILDDEFTAGVSNISFEQTLNSGKSADNNESLTFHGLPVVGFSMQRFTNIAQGKLYGSLFKHRASYKITTENNKNKTP